MSCTLVHAAKTCIKLVQLNSIVYLLGDQKKMGATTQFSGKYPMLICTNHSSTPLLRAEWPLHGIIYGINA